MTVTGVARRPEAGLICDSMISGFKHYTELSENTANLQILYIYSYTLVDFRTKQVA